MLSTPCNRSDTISSSEQSCAKKHSAVSLTMPSHNPSQPAWWRLSTVSPRSSPVKWLKWRERSRPNGPKHTTSLRAMRSRLKKPLPKPPPRRKLQVWPQTPNPLRRPPQELRSLVRLPPLSATELRKNHLTLTVRLHPLYLLIRTPHHPLLTHLPLLSAPNASSVLPQTHTVASFYHHICVKQYGGQSVMAKVVESVTQDWVWRTWEFEAHSRGTREVQVGEDFSDNHPIVFHCIPAGFCFTFFSCLIHYDGRSGLCGEIVTTDRVWFGFDMIVLFCNILCTINRVEMPFIGPSFTSILVDGTPGLEIRTYSYPYPTTHATRFDTSNPETLLAGVKNVRVIYNASTLYVLRASKHDSYWLIS
jgi:hypothetical protein